MTEISVIVPTLEEASVIERTLRGILERRDEAEIDVMVADGGSQDRTVAIAGRYANVVHADMELPPGAVAAVRQKVLLEGYDGGGFSNVFSEHNVRIKRLGRLVNLLQRDNDHPQDTVFFGDDGMFVRRNVFESLGGSGISRSWKTTTSRPVCAPAIA